VKLLKNLSGQTILRQTSAIIALANAGIGVDTGMTHLAVVLGVPTIALFGSTCPYLDAENFKLEIIYKALPCSPCRRKPSCHGDYSCMRSIMPDEVATALRKMLS
jgi:heptosyltransferase-1